MGRTLATIIGFVGLLTAFDAARAAGRLTPQEMRSRWRAMVGSEARSFNSRIIRQLGKIGKMDRVTFDGEKKVITGENADGLTRTVRPGRLAGYWLITTLPGGMVVYRSSMPLGHSDVTFKVGKRTPRSLGEEQLEPGSQVTYQNWSLASRSVEIVSDGRRSTRPDSQRERRIKERAARRAGLSPDTPMKPSRTGRALVPAR